MKIGILGPIWLPIPPKEYGGSELVVYNLVEALVDLGHEVTLFAAGTSKTRARLSSVFDKSVYEIKGKFDFSDTSFDLIHASKAVEASESFDVLHNMVGYQLLPFAPFSKKPFLTTSHSSVLEFEYVTKNFKDSAVVSISNAQREFHPWLNYVGTVYHGIDTQKFVPSNESRDYFLFLSRIMPEKGVHFAIQAAKLTKQKLVIAGNLEKRDEKYFKEEIEPYIDGEMISYVGPVNEKEKIPLYQKAKGLLFPTQWKEAFGLVMIEALACGTPVIAWNNGACPEVVSHKETGFIVRSVEEMAEAMRSSNEINPAICRKRAEEKFSRVQMAKGYEKVYQNLIV